MGFFNIFKKRKNNELQSVMNELQSKMFPGGSQDLYRQVNEIQSALVGKYTTEEVARLISYITSLFMISRDKSAERIVRIGALHRPGNVFTENDAITIYKFVVRLQCKKAIGIDDESVFQEFYKSLGNIEGGATTDVIPNAYGEYGLCVTNPIPVKGVSANEVYLKSLHLLSGENFTWRRIGSTMTDNINDPIDMYQITTSHGQDLCIIYISPYQNIISKKAPKGFYIK